MNMKIGPTKAVWGRSGFLFVAVCAVLLASSGAYAQKGMGDQRGVARQHLGLPIVQLAGKIVSVEIHPCEKTTGPATEGTHLIIEGADGKRYNLHLGPANAVAAIVKQLQPGMQIEVTGFRTAKMPKDHYGVSTLLPENGKPVRLRDSSLRPFWSRRSDLGTGEDRGFTRSGQGRGFGQRAVRHRGSYCGPRRGWGRWRF